MRIHPVVSVAQLEPSAATTAGAPDPYGRKINAEPPPVWNEGDEYQVERVLGKRMLWGKTHYLIKWANWGNEHNVWYSIDDLPDCQDLIKEYEARLTMRSIPASRRSKKTHSKQLQLPLPLPQPDSQAKKAIPIPPQAPLSPPKAPKMQPSESRMLGVVVPIKKTQ